MALALRRLRRFCRLALRLACISMHQYASACSLTFHLHLTTVRFSCYPTGDCAAQQCSLHIMSTMSTSLVLFFALFALFVLLCRRRRCCFFVIVVNIKFQYASFASFSFSVTFFWLLGWLICAVCCFRDFPILSVLPLFLASCVVAPSRPSSFDSFER